MYALKESSYSSHSILMNSLPAKGEGRRVLDLGCGNGYLGAILARRGYCVTGVERAGGVGPDFPEAVRLIETDLDLGIPAAAGKGFEWVLCADILEHLRDPLSMLRPVREILAPGGVLLASLPNSGNFYFRLNVLAGRFPKHDKGLFDRTHLHFYTWDGWQALFDAGGFRIESCQASGIPVGLALPKLAGTVAVKAGERLSYELARLWKTLFAYQFIVSARAA